MTRRWMAAHGGLVGGLPSAADSVPRTPRWTAGLTPHFPNFPHARPLGIPAAKRATQPGMPAGCDAL